MQAQAELTRLLSFGNAHLYDREWLDLDPEQQAFIPQDRFVGCESKVPGRYRYSVVSQWRNAVGPGMGHVPGTAVVRDGGWQVDVEARASSGGGITMTTVLVPVDSRWVWLMDASAARDYQAGRCPTDSLPALK